MPALNGLLCYMFHVLPTASSFRHFLWRFATESGLLKTVGSYFAFPLTLATRKTSWYACIASPSSASTCASKNSDAYYALSNSVMHVWGDRARMKRLRSRMQCKSHCNAQRPPLGCCVAFHGMRPCLCYVIHVCTLKRRHRDPLFIVTYIL